MNKNIAIGIDGGGTKTRVVVKSSLEGEILFEQNFPASNYNNIGVYGIEKVFKEIFNALSKQFENHQLDNATLVMGSAGIDRPQDAEVYRKALYHSGFICKTKVYNDAYIALIGGNGGRQDALIIAGTGSIAIGISRDGNEVRTGGWGAVISDDGSGYKIGVKAISAVMNHYDNILEFTSLTDKIINFYKLKSPEDFIEMIYLDGNLPINKIAACTPIVIGEFEKGDIVSRNIIEEEVTAICKMIVGLGRKMKTESFKLSVAGSLLLKSDSYFNLLKERLASFMPGVLLCKPLYEPVNGAIIIALNSNSWEV